MPDADPFPNPIRSTDPSGVHQPAMNIVAFNFSAQQVGIISGRVDHEGRAKTSAKGNFGLDAQANFSASDLGCIARDKMIHGLFVS